MVTLVEKAEDAIQAEEAAELTKKMMTGALLLEELCCAVGVRCSSWASDRCWLEACMLQLLLAGGRRQAS